MKTIYINPRWYLKEHCIRGDKGDGVPNMLSADDCLVEGVKQKSIMKKKLDIWMHDDDFPGNLPDDIKRNYQRNEELVNLDFTPDDLIEEFKALDISPIPLNKMKLLNFFTINKMRVLASKINDFVPAVQSQGKSKSLEDFY